MRAGVAVRVRPPGTVTEGDWKEGVIRSIDPISKVADVSMKGDLRGITIHAVPPLPEDGKWGGKWGWTPLEETGCAPKGPAVESKYRNKETHVGP